MLEVSLDYIMTKEPITVKEDVTVGAVAQILSRHRINGMLVMSKDNPEELKGLFTTTDLLRLIHSAYDQGDQREAELKRMAEIPVGEECSKGAICLQKDLSVDEAVTLMYEKKIHTIPVYEGEKLVGVIGRHDIFNIALA